MVITDVGQITLGSLMAGGSDIPRFCAIGIGNTPEVASVGSLVSETGTRALFSTRDSTTNKEVEWIYDFSSIAMSGVKLTEFGNAIGSSTGVQNLWNREDFSSITFDGSNELQIQIKFQIF